MPFCIEYPPDMVGENYLPPSGSAIGIQLRQGDYIVDVSAQQSASFYGFSVIGWEQAIQRFNEIDEERYRAFLYGEWVSDKFIESLEKSRKVLMEHLNENQRVDFNAYECFDAIGSESGQYYKIHKQDNFSIEFMKAGIFMCATTNKQVPIYDEMLIFKLFLETDEYGFVQQCNFKNPMEQERMYELIGLTKKTIMDKIRSFHWV